LAEFSTWRARCKLLVSLLGRIGKPWAEELTADWPNKLEHAIKTQGTLQAIRRAVADGVLFELRELVLADAFANLVEQADHLLDQGFFLAAGVLLRAVLEERLRLLVENRSLKLAKPKPTLNDYKTELYKASVYDKITFQEILLLVAIGNDAAHNSPTLAAMDVAKMRAGTLQVLQKFSN
jgi:hypothetical protein